jgi:hypothetical protein
MACCAVRTVDEPMRDEPGVCLLRHCVKVSARSAGVGGAGHNLEMPCEILRVVAVAERVQRTGQPVSFQNRCWEA